MTAAVYTASALALWFVAASALCWANHVARRNLARRRALAAECVRRIAVLPPVPPPVPVYDWRQLVPVECWSQDAIDTAFADIVARDAEWGSL